MSARSLMTLASVRLSRAIEETDPLRALALIELATTDLRAAREHLRIAAAAALAKPEPPESGS